MRCRFGYVEFSHGMLGRCMAHKPISWSAWCVFDGADRHESVLVQVGQGNVSSGQAVYFVETTLLVSKRATASVAEWDALWRGESRQCWLGLVWSRQAKETTYTVGVVVASMLLGGMHPGKLGHVSARPVVVMLGWLWKPPSF